MNRPYIQIARFLNEHSSRLSNWLDIAELKMVKGYFFFFFKMREWEPVPASKQRLAEAVARFLFASGYSLKVRTLEQAASVVRDALPRAIAKIEQRMGWWGDEHTARISSTGSLALSPLDVNVIAKLRKAGLLSIRQVSLVSDESILAIKGIDAKRLRQIRSVCPIHTPAYQRQQEMAKGGQKSLFDKPEPAKTASEVDTEYVSRAERRASRSTWWNR